MVYMASIHLRFVPVAFDNRHWHRLSCYGQEQPLCITSLAAFGKGHKKAGAPLAFPMPVCDLFAE